MSVEHGEYQCRFYKRTDAPIRTVAKAQPDSYPANAGITGG